METIINFLEQYWGYTLFGGVSLGTMITFVITQINNSHFHSSSKKES